MWMRESFKLLLSLSRLSFEPEGSRIKFSPRMTNIFSGPPAEDVFSSFLLVELYNTPLMLIMTRLLLAEGVFNAGDEGLQRKVKFSEKISYKCTHILDEAMNLLLSTRLIE